MQIEWAASAEADWRAQPPAVQRQIAHLAHWVVDNLDPTVFAAAFPFRPTTYTVYRDGIALTYWKKLAEETLYIASVTINDGDSGGLT